MKVVSFDDKITVYILKCYYVDNINDYIKKLILILKRKYKLDIFGFYKINVYQNKKIGLIVEIIKDSDMDFLNGLLELKIKVYEDANMYFRFNDYFFNEKRDIKIINNDYYINVDSLSGKELLQMIEFSKIIYGEELDKILSL